MGIMKKDEAFIPPPFHVYVEVMHYKNCGFRSDEKYVSRVGGAMTEPKAREIIADSIKMMGDTCGGLIDTVDATKRRYSIWKVGEKGWEKVC